MPYLFANMLEVRTSQDKPDVSSSFKDFNFAVAMANSFHVMVVVIIVVKW